MSDVHVEISVPHIEIGFDKAVIREGGGEPYTGEYTVTPSTETQTLPTANKKLTDDVTVNPIPSGWYNTLQEGVVRPDAELIKTFTFDKMAVSDLNLTLPAYTTTATVFLDTENLEEIIAPDTFRYFIVEKFCAIPTYNRSDHLKGRIEYMVSTTCYDVVFAAGGSFKSLSNDDIYDTASRITQANGAVTKQPYYSSDNVFSVYTSSTYGIGATVQSPTVSSGKIICKSPKWQLRGSANYFTSVYCNALTDIRLQYVIDVWRAPVNGMGQDGWNTTQVLNHMVECAQSATHKLT